MMDKAVDTFGKLLRIAEHKSDDGFIRGSEKQILKGNPQNIRLAIDKLGVFLKQNDFAGRTEIVGLTGFGPELTDAGAIRLRLWIEETFGFLPPQLLFDQVLTDIAHANRYHPVREYLDSIEWDGIPRIDNWISTYSGAEDTPFNRAVGRIFLIAGVRRIRQPGAKFDTMLVFEAGQGKEKSLALRTLAVHDEWFTDNLPLGSATKEVIEQTRGVWIAEFAELSGIEKRDVNHVKNFLSKQDDRARPAYGRRSETVPRQFVTAGSTNDAEYLLDMENRRFWPVAITRFNTAKLQKVVPQLWAEAAHYEAKGEPITLQEDLWAAAAVEQADREIESPVKEVLAEKLGRENAGWIPANDIWDIMLVSLAERQRLSRAAGQAMNALGFKRKQNGKASEKGPRGERIYIRGPDDDASTRIRWRA